MLIHSHIYACLHICWFVMTFSYVFVILLNWLQCKKAVKTAMKLIRDRGLFIIKCGFNTHTDYTGYFILDFGSLELPKMF